MYRIIPIVALIGLSWVVPRTHVRAQSPEATAAVKSSDPSATRHASPPTGDAAETGSSFPRLTERLEHVATSSSVDAERTRNLTFVGLTFIAVFSFVLLKLLKGQTPRSNGLPPEVVQLIGTLAFDHKQSIHVLRCGTRILLIGSTANGLTTLGQISDPEEVDELVAAWRAGQDRKGFLGRLTSAMTVGRPHVDFSNASPDTLQPDTENVTHSDRQQTETSVRVEKAHD